MNCVRAQGGGRLRDLANWSELLGGNEMIERHGYRAGEQNREIAEHPVGRVLADQQDAIARLDSTGRQQQRRSMCAVAQLAIGGLGLLARRTARDHRDSRAVAIGGAIEHVDEATIARQRFGAAAGVQIELRKNVPSQAGQMNVDPVVVPVDQVGTERMALGVGRLERRVQLAHVDSRGKCR